MVKFIVFLFFWGLSFLCPSYSQTDKTFRFSHIGLSEGLSQSTVVDIAQDKYGNMWFATYNGLNKYNGYEFTVYKHNEQDSCSIGENIVRACHQDNSGNIWAGTARGLSLYDADKDNFRNFIYPAACDIRGIADFDENRLLLMANKQLLLFDRVEGLFLEKELPAIFSSISPTSLRQQDDK